MCADRLSTEEGSGGTLQAVPQPGEVVLAAGEFRGFAFAPAIDRIFKAFLRDLQTSKPISFYTRSTERVQKSKFLGILLRSLLHAIQSRRYRHSPQSVPVPLKSRRYPFDLNSGKFS